MRLAFVVQRYGREVNGGAELHCRMLAERLARRSELDEVTVFTTCAKNYETWENHYASGSEMLEGVRVERFPSQVQRCSQLQSWLGWLFRHVPHPEFAESSWLLAQGPVVPGLLRRLEEVKDRYDVFIFFTYLYYPTVRGLSRVGHKRILIPTAHDEPALRLKLFRTVFSLPEAFAFNTLEERDLVEQRFGVPRERTEIVGCGVDVLRPRASARARRAPYLLYLGRINRHKGVANLVRSFLSFKKWAARESFQSQTGTYFGSELELVLAGSGDPTLVPEHPDISWEGFVSDQRKLELLRDAELLVMPSRYESLSIVMLEAWTFEIPVVTNSECAITSGHIARSGGGKTYRGPIEFRDAAAALLRDRKARAEIGRLGRTYVETNYSWPHIESKLLELARRVAAPAGSTIHGRVKDA